MAAHDTQVRVRGRLAALIEGHITVEDLDDEEVARGQLRAADGTFRGARAVVIPAVLVQAMRREWLSRAETMLRSALMEKGIGTLTKLAGDESIDPAVRLRAADKLIERTMGKVPDKIQVAHEDPLETLIRSIVDDPEGLADRKPVPREPTPDEIEEMLS